MLDLLERLQDFHAKLHAKMSNVDHTLTANQKETKLFVFVKKDGLSFLLIFQKAVLISMNVMNRMAHQECVELMLNAPIPMEHLTVSVHPAFPETLTNNALTSMNVHKRMLVATMQFVKILKDHSHVFAQKVQLLTQTQLCDALLLFLAIPTMTALEMQFATHTNVASALNQTSVMIVAIHVNI